MRAITADLLSRRAPNLPYSGNGLEEQQPAGEESEDDTVDSRFHVQLPQLVSTQVPILHIHESLNVVWKRHSRGNVGEDEHEARKEDESKPQADSPKEPQYWVEDHGHGQTSKKLGGQEIPPDATPLLVAGHVTEEVEESAISSIEIAADLQRQNSGGRVRSYVNQREPQAKQEVVCQEGSFRDFATLVPSGRPTVRY